MGPLLAGILLTALALQPASVLVVRVEGPITVGAAEYVRAALASADPSIHRGVLIVLNSDGGFLEPAMDVASSIMASPVPVAVYVPRGGRAFSAAAAVLLSAHHAASSPSAVVGACEPWPADEKVVSAVAGWMRSLAEARGRNSTAAELMVRENLVLSGREAAEAGVVDVLADDERELLERLGWSGPAEELSPDVRSAVLILITDPVNAWFLVVVGGILLVAGLLHPTYVMEGAGSCLIILGLYGLNLLGASLAAVGLTLLGVATMVLELKTGHGALALVGAVMASTGLLMMYQGAPLLRPGAGGWGAVAAALAGAGLLAIYARKVREAVKRAPTVGDLGRLVGAEGVVKRAIPAGGEGVVLVGSELWTARSDSPIPEGRRVRVVRVEGFRLVVEEVV
ncbi:MAG: hypothetical protein DRO06_04270 [Thermoproteota archaeon]|mgnify:CR=1 FL=1|nr:MAG: hypothetical protein DRO06_04270 [Candidatus Korarchaeota archaeon]